MHIYRAMTLNPYGVTTVERIPVLTSWAEDKHSSAMTQWLVALSAVSLGCSLAAHPPTAYHVRLDPNLTAEQSELTLSVLYEWSQATGFTYDTNVSASACGFDLLGSRGCMHLQNVTNVRGHCPTGQCCAPNQLSGVPGISTEIYLQDLGANNAKALRHEIGHALGLAHDRCYNEPAAGVEGTAMCRYWSGSPDRVTDRDVLQYEDVRSYSLL